VWGDQFFVRSFYSLVCVELIEVSHYLPTTAASFAMPNKVSSSEGDLYRGGLFWSFNADHFS
jgi:hypothetical protein